MRCIRLPSLVALAWLIASPARGVDYDAVDRAIGKEPGYTGAPQYALLLFGREAKLRVWAVLDGDTLHLDRNADGDLIDEGERFEKIEQARGCELADPDGKTRYVIESLSKYEDGEPGEQHLMAFIDIEGPIAYGQYCDVKLTDAAKSANVAHFHGPLTAGPITVNFKVPEGYSLVKGDSPTDLRMMVGTLSAKHHCWVVVRSHHDVDGTDTYAFRKGVCPEVDVEFPSASPGDPPLKRTYKLEEFC